MANDIGGVWRTIGGRRVFIKDGQDLASAMKESGKFKSTKTSKKGKDEVKERLEIAKDIAKELDPSLKNASDERLEKEAKKLLEAPEGAVDEKTTFYTNEKGGLERSTSDLKKWRDDLTKKENWRDKIKNPNTRDEILDKELDKSTRDKAKEFWEKEDKGKKSEIYFMDQELGAERPIPSREEWEKEWNSRRDREDYADTSYEGLINALEDNGTINREQAKQYLEKNSKTPLTEEEFKQDKEIREIKNRTYNDAELYKEIDKYENKKDNMSREILAGLKKERDERPNRIFNAERDLKIGDTYIDGSGNLNVVVDRPSNEGKYGTKKIN